jgi:hypothetical protein
MKWTGIRKNGYVPIGAARPRVRVAVSRQGRPRTRRGGSRQRGPRVRVAVSRQRGARVRGPAPSLSGRLPGVPVPSPGGGRRASGEGPAGLPRSAGRAREGEGSGHWPGRGRGGLGLRCGRGWGPNTKTAILSGALVRTGAAGFCENRATLTPRVPGSDCSHHRSVAY